MDPKRSPPPPPTATKITRTTSSGGSGSIIILEKYQLGRLLGRGSFAKVYHATSLDDNSDVAIKVIDKATTVDAAMEPRIVREVSAMRRLDHHPNILKLQEVMATKTKIYLVMELAPGGELFAKLSRQRRFSESTARRYFHQLVSALIFCHQNGIAHRDIKPQNLLLDKKGSLKITDFGLSALPEQKKDGLIYTACGTPAYTAPEVVYRKGYDGSKADAWSSGVLLYVFLVGCVPFDDRNLANMYRAIHHRAFEFPPWVSKPAKNIIFRLLDPNPKTRLSLEELITLPWFNKSFSQRSLVSHRHQLLDRKLNYLARINAFDIILMSSGLDLSGLFESEKKSKEMRFTSISKVEEIEEKVVRIGGGLGYRIERQKGGRIGLVKGSALLVVEIWEMAHELWLVEVKMFGGGGVGGGDLQWEELKLGLSDVFLSWHNGPDAGSNMTFQVIRTV